MYVSEFFCVYVYVFNAPVRVCMYVCMYVRPEFRQEGPSCTPSHLVLQNVQEP